jgi:Na+(H+)/acetate symporter ActP
MGIFSRKISGKAAVWGMCAGIGVTMLYVFQHKGIMFIPGTSFLGGMDANWFLGISLSKSRRWWTTSALRERPLRRMRTNGYHPVHSEW